MTLDELKNRLEDISNEVSGDATVFNVDVDDDSNSFYAIKDIVVDEYGDVLIRI
ncbi:hypothetical protein [Clostridium butyricum]|uniref:Uncharacterized protein n=1 Tax=Clostridium butyricum E4 str. BoNT E BL5262 TaxID=632245 RepID=C4IFC9_CLOBU|nr:hypothetical protein [Clostridium butyricum]EDT73393.1 hypothetical protein CBY_0691 [Clostridium butyricum 5521]EDT75834.1 hypothetical protein CBY_2846 [Clostridium butyricum 5521]EEP53101.1 hypothetical protein CLP_2709 [Clostridium butyricum E4 str. BoNT E BL5262]EEP53213.1 hypothetical protein CLP_2930 [Clostridium butyricum E4 str. BoNT E BL5262]EEP53235.1 hypothetical protein CLP_1633 [Clostridium butyricum E4 str. BoNT E BL5262]